MKRLTTIILSIICIFLFVNNTKAAEVGILKGKTPSAAGGRGMLNSSYATDGNLETMATLQVWSTVTYDLNEPKNIVKITLNGNSSGGYFAFYDTSNNLIEEIPVFWGQRTVNLNNVKQVVIVNNQPANFNIAELELYEGIVDKTPPKDIVNFDKTVSAKYISLYWSNPSDLDFKTVNIYVDGNKIGESAIGSYKITDLEPLRRYEIMLKAVDTSNNESSGYSTEITTADITRNVKSLESSNTTKSGTVLSWVNPLSPTFKGTKIYRDDVLIDILDKTTTSYEISGLIHSTNYVFKVTSLDTDGTETSGSSIDVRTLDLEPVKNVSDVDVSSQFNRVNLSWHLPKQDDFKHVNIYREKIEKPGFFERLFSISSTKVYAAASTKIFETNGTYFNDLTVLPETKYEYTLTTQTTDNRESDGVTVSVQTKEEPPPVMKDDGYIQTPEGDYVFKWTEPTTGKVKVLIDGKEFKTVDATLKQVVIPKEQMKYTPFGDPKVSLIAISSTGKEGTPTTPGGGVIDEVKVPFNASDLLKSIFSALLLISPFLLLSLGFYYYKPLKDLIKKAVG